MNQPQLIIITGPTATGKTALAIELATRYDAEIVSADSRQVYRYLDIGTAKPTHAQRAVVAHHLIDVANPDEQFDGARFRAPPGQRCFGRSQTFQEGSAARI